MLHATHCCEPDPLPHGRVVAFALRLLEPGEFAQISLQVCLVSLGLSIDYTLFVCKRKQRARCRSLAKRECVCVCEREGERAT